jgi:hypothetical protein
MLRVSRIGIHRVVGVGRSLTAPRLIPLPLTGVREAISGVFGLTGVFGVACPTRG